MEVWVLEEAERNGVVRELVQLAPYEGNEQE